MSVFKQMIELRDMCVERYSLNVETLDWLKDGTIPSTKRNVVTIKGNNYNLKFFDDHTCKILKDQTEITDAFTYDEYQDIMNEDLFGANGYTINDLFIKAGETTTVYDVLSQLSTKFSFTNRVRLSDINDYLAQCGDIDVSTLKNDLFQISNNEGYITLPAFMQCIDSYMKAGKDATDQDSLELDETNPFTLQSIMNIAVQAVSSLITVICAALSQVFGSFLVLIGLIIDLITKLWNAMDSVGEYTYDATASSNFVLGSVAAIDGFGQFLRSVDWNLISKTRNVRYRERYGIGSFIWWNQDYTDFRMNNYLYPCYKPYEGLKYCVDNNLIRFTGDGFANSSIIVDSAFNLVNGMFSAIPSYDKDGTVPDSQAEAMASLAFTTLLLQILGYVKLKMPDSSSDTSFYISSFFNHTTPSGADDEKALFRAAQLLEQAWVFGSNSKTDFMKVITDGKYDRHFANSMTSWLAGLVLPNGNNYYGRATDHAGMVVIGTNIGGSNNDQWPILYSYSFVSDFIGYSWNSSVNEGSLTRDSWLQGYLADCLPASFQIKLPVANIDVIEQALTAIATIVVATVITTTPLRMSMRMRKAGKEALRSSDLNAKREAFIADPTNHQKEIEYERAALKFDTFGKIFGWGSYDAANGWINAPTTSGSSLISNFATTYSQNQRDSTNINALLTAIKNLIHSE